MKINVGSGEELLDGYTNVDLRDVADVQADVRDLPFPSGSVDEVRAFNVLEHLSEFDYPSALVEWHRVLKPGGILRVQVPNMHALCVQIAARFQSPGGQAIEGLIRNVYGGHRFGENGELDTHHWGWTPAYLHAVLSDHGFDTLSNDEALNMTIEARKRQ